MTIYAIKRLLVVLAIGATVCYLAKPIALQFTSNEDFTRRRFVWLFLTAVSFLSPSFWLYAFVAAPIFLWVSRKDSNPIAAYLMMLHVVLPVGFPIPILGNSGLFELDNYRLLAFCILLPVTIRYRKNRDRSAKNRFDAMDFLLLAFGVLQASLYTAPDLGITIPDSLTNVLRRAFLFFLDTYLLYFAVSRTCCSRRQIIDAAATFCLVCGIMASIAIFENVRHWLLYVEVAGDWGVPIGRGLWLTRGDELRAQASAGHSLALGCLLAVGFGFWLYLKTYVQSAAHRIGVTVVLWGGLYAAFSRGPWLGAVTAYFTFIAAGPRAVSRLLKGGLAAAAVAVLILVSPIGDRILNVLPGTGKATDGTIAYRQRLAERGWEIVLAHPFFGDQNPWHEMEDLRQGEGIIDMVNTYLGVAMNYGLVGLFCFTSFILFALRKVYSRARHMTRSDPDLVYLGASLIACTVAILEMIYSASFILGAQKMFYVLAGIATAYAGLSESMSNQTAALSTRNSLQG